MKLKIVSYNIKTMPQIEISKIKIGVMGSGNDADPKDIKNAYELGKAIAEKGWIVLSGGRNVGVMEASLKGAKDGGGITIGILPGNDSSKTSEYVDIEILTDLVDYNIKEIIYPSPVTRHPSPDINQTEITQPVIFAFQYALAK